MQNKYRGTCHICGAAVAPKQGSLHRQGRRWLVTCQGCQSGHEDQMTASRALELANGDEEQAAGIYAAQKSAGRDYQSWGAYFPGSGAYIYQNKGGRCIDAPCCGCCS
jgi:hypothetical protein